MKRRYWVALASLAIWLAIAVFFAAGIEDPANIRLKDYQTDYFKEGFKYFVQLTLIGVIGSILVQEYNRIRQRQIDLKEHRKGIYAALAKVYLDTKKVRWTLRTNLRDDQLDHGVLKQEIGRLVNIKSELEIINYEIGAYHKAFKPSEREPLTEKVDLMEDYLRHIIKEYCEFSKNSSEMMELKRLNSFLMHTNGRQAEADFSANFRIPFKEAIELNTLKEEKTTE